MVCEIDSDHTYAGGTLARYGAGVAQRAPPATGAYVNPRALRRYSRHLLDSRSRPARPGAADGVARSRGRGRRPRLAGAAVSRGGGRGTHRRRRRRFRRRNESSAADDFRYRRRRQQQSRGRGGAAARAQSARRDRSDCRCASMRDNAARARAALRRRARLHRRFRHALPDQRRLSSWKASPTFTARSSGSTGRSACSGAGGPCYRCLYPEPPPPESRADVRGGRRARRAGGNRRLVAGERSAQDAAAHRRAARRGGCCSWTAWAASVRERALRTRSAVRALRRTTDDSFGGASRGRGRDLRRRHPGDRGERPRRRAARRASCSTCASRTKRFSARSTARSSFRRASSKRGMHELDTAAAIRRRVPRRREVVVGRATPARRRIRPLSHLRGGLLAYAARHAEFAFF